MAGTDTQKQLLTLIRDFASEKSQGERRVLGLKKRIDELQSELEAANAELEVAKRIKETTEQELKGYEVELASNGALIQALEARICTLQDEICSIGSEVDDIKNEEGASRDEFIGQMLELNDRIRKFQERIAAAAACEFQKENSTRNAAETDCKVVKNAVTDVDSRKLEDMLAHLVSQTTKEEQEYLAEENIQKQLQQEYVDFQRKVSLMEVITNETRALQDLARYPYKYYIVYGLSSGHGSIILLQRERGPAQMVIKMTSELEHTCTSLGEELQKRCVCPSCHADNVDALGGILQAN